MGSERLCGKLGSALGYIRSTRTWDLWFPKGLRRTGECSTLTPQRRGEELSSSLFS